MKDAELRAIALQRFYAERRRNSKIWNESDVPAGVDPIDFFDVCGQLAQHDLIDWKPIMDMFTVKSGQGKITASGVDVVEGTVKSPIAITFDHRSITITGSNNVQVGDNNSFSSLLNLEKITAAIENSQFSVAEKTEAKNLLTVFLKHPLVTSIAGGVAGGLAARTS